MQIMDVEATIKKIIMEQINADISESALLADTNLQNVGMDSIAFIKIIVEIETAFDVDYPDDKLLIAESGTLKQISSIVEEALANL